VGVQQSLPENDIDQEKEAGHASMAAVSGFKSSVPNKSAAFLTRPFAYFLLKEVQHWNGTFSLNQSVF